LRRQYLAGASGVGSGIERESAGADQDDGQQGADEAFHERTPEA
jgi:hypothetical protein